jgi:hypothetical protein
MGRAAARACGPSEWRARCSRTAIMSTKKTQPEGEPRRCRRGAKGRPQGLPAAAIPQWPPTMSAYNDWPTVSGRQCLADHDDWPTMTGRQWLADNAGPQWLASMTDPSGRPSRRRSRRPQVAPQVASPNSRNGQEGGTGGGRQRAFLSPAILSKVSASLTSRSVRPPAECVDKVTSTRFHTLVHSG